MAAKPKTTKPTVRKRKGAGKLKVAKATKTARSNQSGDAKKTSAAKKDAAKMPGIAKAVTTPDWAKATRYLFRSGS